MKKDIIILAKELMSVPSVTLDVTQSVAVLEVAKKQLKRFPMEAFVADGIPSLLYSNTKNEMRNFKVVLNAHLDVVPSEPDQFIPTEKDGKLYGRGAHDMKAAAAVMILLFKELADKLSFPLALQLVTDEETSGPFGTGYQVGKGVRAEFVIIGECNSNFRITNESKGRKVLTLTAQGKTSHSAYSWLGENAIYRIHTVIASILHAFPIAQEETQGTILNVTQINTENTATNKIPKECTAIIDIRFNPSDEETITNKIMALIPPGITAAWEHTRPSQFTHPDSKYVKLLEETTTNILGKKFPLRFAHATSDAPFYSGVGCQAIEFGPIGGNAHEENEWVDIKSLEDYYTILKTYLLEIDRLKL